MATATASSRVSSETAVQSSSAMKDDVEKTGGAAPASPPATASSPGPGPGPAPGPGSGPGPGQGPGTNAEENYKPKSWKFWSIIISIFLALFLVALDRTIIGTATPQITEEFHSQGDIGWYGSAYQLTTAASQLLFGRVYRFYDVKITFLVSVAVFEIGSLVCGVAPSSITFIIGRAIAGLGSAGIFSGVQIIMIPMVPLRKRPMFQGLFGTVFGLASVLGPLVGGAFTDGATWRWCFYVNLPIGAVAAVCLIFMLHPPKRPTVKATIWEQVVRLDPLGTLCFVPSVVSLLIALQWGGSTYSWGSWRIILLLTVFAVLFVAFGAVQYFLPNSATVPLRVIRRRSILAGAIFMFALAGSMLMCIYYLPIWFQVVKGASAVQSGIYTLPFVLSLVTASIGSGIITGKIGYYVPAMIASPSIMAVGQGLMSTFTITENVSHWVGYQFLTGFGLGLGMQASVLAAQAVLPPPDIPTGIAIMFFSQQLGGGIFTSVGQNILSEYLVSHVSDIPGVDPKQVTTEGATDLVKSVPPEDVDLVKTIYNQAIRKIFLCAMGVALVAVVAALFMEWKNVKKTGPPGGGPPGAKPAEGKDVESKGQQGRPNSATGSGSEEDAAAMFKRDPLEPPKPRTEIFRLNGTPRSSREIVTPPPKIGCDHCEHCRLSRAITIAPSEPASRLSRQSASSPNLLTGTPPAALEEAARLATIARDAMAQLEEFVTRPYSVTGQVGPSGRLSAEPRPETARRQSIGAPEIPGRHRRRSSVTRQPAIHELVQNAHRVSVQLERQEQEERAERESRESQRRASQAQLSRTTTSE
ncbi:major facilitator superfamily domain-containing protein [Xylariomycetidae sp. FL0641]|nr:major facilitator superfamily domain-containing protein [Xylariomycetidae sp. FL0641]